MFLSRDFYSPASMGTHIKSPVELVVSTYKKLGRPRSRAFPTSTRRPAPWARRCSGRRPWPAGRRGAAGSRPGLLLERGNFALDVLFPDIGFVPHDRHAPDPTILAVHERIRPGLRHHQRDHARGRRRRRRHDGRVQHDGRSRRGLQHALRLLSRLADGDRQGQADPARGGRHRSRGHGARRGPDHDRAGGRLLPAALHERAARRRRSGRC